MIDREDTPTNTQRTDQRAFRKNRDRLRTDGGITEEENLPQKPEKVETTETNGEEPSETLGKREEGGILQRAKRTATQIVGDKKFTSQHGRQSPTEESSIAHEQSLNSTQDLNLEDASRAINQMEADVQDWNQDRSEYELAMQKARNEFESGLAEHVKDIGKEVAKVQKWAESPLDEHMTYEADPNRGSHSFGEYDDLGLAEFVSVLSDEAEEADQLYTHRQEEIAELGKELDQMKDQDIGIEDSEELAASKNLGTDSKEISDYERRAVTSRRQEVSDEIEMHRNKKNQHEQDFVERTTTAENAYREHATEVGDYIADAVENLQETTSMLEEMTDVEVPVLEEELYNSAPDEIAGKILDDGEQEVRDEYRDAVNALGVKAAEQYSQIESALTELEEIEAGMNNDYFGDVMRSDKMRDRVDQVSGGQDYAEHLENTVNEAIGDEYAASDKIRNVFRGIEPELS